MIGPLDTDIIKTHYVFFSNVFNIALNILVLIKNNSVIGNVIDCTLKAILKYFKAIVEKLFVSCPRPGEFFFQSEPTGTLTIFLLLNMISTLSVFVLSIFTFI